MADHYNDHSLGIFLPLFISFRLAKPQFWLIPPLSTLHLYWENYMLVALIHFLHLAFSKYSLFFFLSHWLPFFLSLLCLVCHVAWSLILPDSHIYSYIFLFCVLVLLGFELRALGLQIRRATTWAIPPAPDSRILSISNPLSFLFLFF
jgi:hypothetical protein